VRNAWLKTVIDFGDLPIFEATTYPCILIAGNRRPSNAEATAQALNVRSMATLERLADAVRREGWPQPQRSLRRDGWAFARPEVLALMEKLRHSGTRLGEYVGGRLYYGIKTGLNTAFVIDQTTQDRLIAEDPGSADVIKPWLRGRDVKRWRVEWSGLYVVFTRRGIDIDRYPAVKNYLAQFKARLMPGVKGGRKPGNYEWYEIQDTIDYYTEFEKPKIIVPAIVRSASYAFDTEGFYSNDKTTIIPTNDLYLVGLLNSKALEFVMHSISAARRGGYFEYKPMYLEQLPIPDANPAQRNAIEALVRRLLDVEGQGPQIAEWERELNALVYEVYGLTEEEIGVVEGRLDHE